MIYLDEIIELKNLFPFYIGKNLLVNEKFPDKVIEDVYELSVSQYSKVRSCAQSMLGKILNSGDIRTEEKILSLLENSLKPGVPHHEFKGALYILANKDFLHVYHSWKNVSTLYPALVQAQHSDKETLVEQLKIIFNMLNPNHEDNAMWTMSFRPAMMTEKIARSLGASEPWQGK